MRVYRRTERGEWRVDPDVVSDGHSLELPTLSGPIAVADIYDGIVDASGRSLLRDGTI